MMVVWGQKAPPTSVHSVAGKLYIGTAARAFSDGRLIEAKLDEPQTHVPEEFRRFSWGNCRRLTSDWNNS